MSHAGGNLNGGHRPSFLRRGKTAFGVKPPQTQIFELLRSAGHNAAHSAELIETLMRTWPEDRGVRESIVRAEHDGDRLTHKIVNCLRESKMSPFDREDIYALTGAIDDLVDDIEEVSDLLGTQRVEAPMEQAQALAGVLRDAGRALAAALDALESLDGIEEHLARVRTLEQEGDRIYRSALAALFDGAIDPMFVLRWKDIFSGLEEAIDRSRSAANSLESIVMKHT
jgi:hypothetical protein